MIFGVHGVHVNGNGRCIQIGMTEPGLQFVGRELVKRPEDPESMAQAAAAGVDPADAGGLHHPFDEAPGCGATEGPEPVQGDADIVSALQAVDIGGRYILRAKEGAGNVDPTNHLVSWR